MTRPEYVLTLSAGAGIVGLLAPWLAAALVRAFALRRFSRAIERVPAVPRELGGPRDGSRRALLAGSIAPGSLLGVAMLLLVLLPTALSPAAGDRYARGAGWLIALDAVSCVAAGVVIVASARGWRLVGRDDPRASALEAAAGERERARRATASERGLRRDSAREGCSVEGIRRMSGQAFERLCAGYFEGAGYAVDLTPMGGDGGVDLVATRDGRLVLVQCKQTRKPVGEPVVRDLYGAVHHAGADRGAVCSSNGFTAAAATWADGKPITLVSGEEIAAAMRRR